MGKSWRHALRGARRALALAMAGVVVASVALLASPSAQSEALPRGETATYPGGLVISNYVLPDGRRAYCIEIEMGEPTGESEHFGEVVHLPGRSGMFEAWDDPTGMRQMNYLIAVHGQDPDVETAAAVQLTIWRMRANFQSGNAKLNGMIATLEGSARGRELIARSDALIADARANALVPRPPEPVREPLTIAADPAGVPGRYRVAYPAGTTMLSVDNGTFVRDGSTALTVPATSAGARYVDIDDTVMPIAVSGRWRAEGTRGWEPKLDVYNTWTTEGALGQRVAVAVGRTTIEELTGAFETVSLHEGLPEAGSLAQPTATIGGTMTDTIIVSARPGTTPLIWPGATGEFEAFLLPEAGAPKYDGSWNPVLGPEYEAEVTDPDTGEVSTATKQDPLMWTQEEIDAMTFEEACVVQRIYRQPGVPITALGEYRSHPVDVKSTGTVHWVERIIDGNGVVVHEGECGLANETTMIGQPAVSTRALPSAEVGQTAFDVATVSGELAEEAEYALRFEAYASGLLPGAASNGPVCDIENRVLRTGLIPVGEAGDYRSPELRLATKHGAEIWWVETFHLRTPDGFVELHRGECGIENETTRIDRPTVETLAQSEAAIGDHMLDVATVSGALEVSADASWELEFAVFGERYADDRTADAGSESGAEGTAMPVCGDENLLARTDAIEVSGPGSYTSPPVRAEAAWAGSIWWRESLWIIEGGERSLVHEGECGISNETTQLQAPEVVTDADAFVALGGKMRDTATITGPLTSRAGVGHEVVFEGYRGDSDLTGGPAALCTPENRLFTTEPVVVDTGESGDRGSAGAEPGAPDAAAVPVRVVTSPWVSTYPEHGDTVWWVETLYQREGDELRELHRGDCGVTTETTRVGWPEVRTESAGTVTVGEEMYDTAIVEGQLDGREGVEFRVRFTAYERDGQGAVVCEPSHEIDELSDAEGVIVTGPGRYESRRVTTQQKHVGLGGYVETLIMIEGDDEHVVHIGDCGAEDENFEIVADTPVAAPPTYERPDDPDDVPLVPTGSGSPAAPLYAGGVAVLLGIAAVLGAARLSRGKRPAGAHPSQ